MTALNTPGAVRQAIREKVRTLLLNQTPAGAKVFVGRSFPSDAEQLPVVLIYTTGENISKFNEAPKDYQRNLNLLIEVQVAGNSDEDVDLQREAFADKIEALLEKDETLGDLVDRIELNGNEFSDDSGGESPMGRLAILYSVRYYLQAVQETDIHEFQGVDVDWKIKRAEELPDSKDAEDTINLQV